VRILLIDPPFYRFMGIQNRYFPIGLGYIAASLRNKGYEVRIYSADKLEVASAPDYSRMHDHYKAFIRQVNDKAHHVWKDIVTVLKDFRPDVVGITAMTPKIAAVLKTATVCKEYNNQLNVVIGGPHATIKPEEILQYKDVDYVIRGEGEVSMVKLVSAIEKMDTSLFKEIGGLSYRLNGNIVNNLHLDYINDLDTIPFPARELLLYPENYSSEDMAIIMTSRGCPFSCTFCYKEMFGKKVRYRSVGNVIEEIKHVMQKYGAKQFAFKDDSFTLNKKRVVEFCDVFATEGIKINWECTTRVDLIDEDLLKKMMSAGCNTIKVGVESGSENMLKLMKKGITHEKVRKAAKLFNKHGIFWSAYFMMGLPNETEEDIYKTLEFMKDIRPGYASIGVYEPYPGTELFETGLKLGIVNSDMPPSQYFERSPDEYYLRDIRRRVNTIEYGRFETIKENVLTGFDNYNKSIKRLLKRGFARRKMYYYDPKSFIKDIRRVFRWINA